MTEVISACPSCNSKKVALIFWGYPGDIEWYLQAAAEKKIVGGGCNITDHDPKWECNECFHRWGERDE